MKHVLLFGLMLASFLSYSQYPASGAKQRLGWQTTGDGLVYRGAIGDTSTLDPSGLNNAWMLLDTVSGTMYAYRQKAWRLVSGGGGGVSMPFDSITFNINEGDASEQELKYSADKGYLQYGGLDSVQIPLLPGIWYVRNDTSVTIPKGTVVRASGTLGASGRIKVKHMIANGTIPAMYVLGIAMQDIAVGADGYVMTQGKIRQVNTTAYSEGAVLYADVDTLGGLTQTEPGNGYLKLPIAFVVHSASNGVLAVRVNPGLYLRDLHDVDTTGRVGGSVLQYDSALKYWKASTTAGIVAGDTSAMLTNYINVVDTAAMLTNYVNIADTAAMLTNYINIADTATMLSSYISNADTSVFARDFQISGTSGQVTYFNGTNTVTGDANLTWSAANRTLGINTMTTSGANIIIKNTQEPIRDAAWLPQQTFGADTTNWTRGTGWTFNGTQAVATAATGALTYTTLPDTIISGRAYEVTYTLASYSAGTVTVALGNATLALPAYNVTGNAVLLQPTSATGGFRFTTSTFTGNLDNVAVVEVRNPAPTLIAGQDDGSATLYAETVAPNSTSYAVGGGGKWTTQVQNFFLGSNAGLYNTTGFANSFIGFNAGSSNTTGYSNFFMGSRAGESNTIGLQNTFLGDQAGRFSTTGSNNVYIGRQSGLNATTASDNIFMGFQTGLNNNASSNIFIGSQSGTNNTTGTQNVYIGNTSGIFNTTSSFGVNIGSNAGRENTTGNSNINLGVNAGRQNKSGAQNIMIGESTGNSNKGSLNIFFGQNTGFNSTTADTLNGGNNTLLGSNAARNIASSAAGNLVLGNSVNLPTGNGSNQVVIKNLIFGTGASGTGTTIQTTAKAGINVNNPQSTLDVEGNMAIGTTYSGTTAAPTNGLIVEGNTGIGTNSPQRRLHVEGEARVSDLTTDTPTRIIGADADGDLGEISLGTGLSIASGTLNTSAILPADTSVFARDFQISGTGGYVPKFTTSSTIANSALYNPANSKVMIGHTSGNSLTNNLEIHSAGNSAIAQPSLDIYMGADGFADYTPYIQLYRNRSTTVGGVTKVNNTDWLGRLTFQGADGAKYVRGAQIYAITDATTGLDSMPTALRFATNGGTTSQPTDRMSITSAGHVGIGTTTPAEELTVQGTVLSQTSVSASEQVDGIRATKDYTNGNNWIATQQGTQGWRLGLVGGTLDATNPYDFVFYHGSSTPTASSPGTERFRFTTTGRLGIGATSPARTLHVTGEARITDLTTDTPTRIVGADADGDLGEITLGTGLSISSGTLNASGITSIYIPINLFSPGDTVTNTTNSKNFFLVHSGLNGYCIDSYTVKAIAGTGSADIQLDKNGTGGNLQAISGTTVYTKDTNIALVTGDYIRGQVFNLSGTLIGLGLTLEIKATCN